MTVWRGIDCQWLAIGEDIQKLVKAKFCREFFRAAGPPVLMSSPNRTLGAGRGLMVEPRNVSGSK
jgi:hypothetical protein